MELSELFERQSNRIYRTAMVYMKNPEEAEDVVQVVMLKYIEKHMDFADQNHENAWIITVTRNYCKDMLKAFWRKNVELGEIPELSYEEAESQRLLDEMLKLPIKYREVLYLYYYEEYSIREMSKILNRSESTIQTQLAAARKKLKQILETEAEKNE